MRPSVLLLFFAIVTPNIAIPSGSKVKDIEKVQKDAVRGLIRRLLPEDNDKFTIKIDFDMKKNDKDLFEISSMGSEDPVHIKASSGVAAAAGFHHYLKYFCAAHVSWDFNQLNLANCRWQEGIYELIEFNDKYRYYQNACTPGYSFVWWNWAKWEEHIDWMAMQGFNLVPAMNGQEALWKRVYENLGMTSTEIDAHFAGPAFLPWNRMGNLRAFGGPLSMWWHNQQLKLNKLIIARMREFGIVTVLPAFAGQVPQAFKRLYPNAIFYELPRWNGFDDEYLPPLLLDPLDKLFQEIGVLFLNQVKIEFGSDHIYNCDTFNEMTPFTTDLQQLRQIGEAIYASMTAVDPQAIWLMQGWIFHHELLYWTKRRAQALLTSIPLGKMIILDLQSEQFPQYDRLDNYFGQPYIWCMLHNFGGTLGMFGSAEIINNRVFEARKMPNSTLIGTGLTPEGINQNYVIYDLMVEMAYRKSPANLQTWFKDYTIRRYGQSNDKVIQSWDILRTTVYNFNTTKLMRGKFVYNQSPRLKIVPWSWYNQSELFTAWKLISNEHGLLKSSRNFRHDLIDINRQVLQNLMDKIFVEMIDAFTSKNIDKFEAFKTVFIYGFNIIENVLSLDEKWLLGKWLNEAKSLAENDEDRKSYEYNARNQITLWGPDGQIKDYANKQWSGIVGDFFKPRWTLFLQHMSDSLAHDVKFNEKGAKKDVFEKVEQPFTFSRKVYPDLGKSINEIFKLLQENDFEINKMIKFLAENQR